MKALTEAKSFLCLGEKCEATVHVDSGTLEGTVIKHRCGAKGVLVNEGRSWFLMPHDDPRVDELLGKLTVKTEESMETETVAPKKKRGRPPKVTAAPLSEDVKERDANLLRGVEADCPHDVNSPEGQTWCSAEFDKRKTNIDKKKPQPDGSQDKFDKEFIKEAEASDKRIDKALRRGGESFFEAIKELVESGDKGYFKALGFNTFEKYREAKTEYSRSHIGQGIQVYKALHGRIPDEKYMALPLPTAVLLTKIPESKLTEELVDEIKGLTIQEFKEKRYPELSGQLVNADGTPQAVTPEEFAWVPRIRAHQQVVERWKRLMTVAKWKAAGLVDENDVYANFTNDEKALIIIAVECLSSSGWEHDYEEANTVTAVDEEPAF